MKLTEEQIAELTKTEDLLDSFGSMIQEKVDTLNGVIEDSAAYISAYIKRYNKAVNKFKKLRDKIRAEIKNEILKEIAKNTNVTPKLKKLWDMQRAWDLDPEMCDISSIPQQIDEVWFPDHGKIEKLPTGIED